MAKSPLDNDACPTRYPFDRKRTRLQKLLVNNAEQIKPVNHGFNETEH